MKAIAVCDGRGNAGTGARAVVLSLENGQCFEKAEKLGPRTNIVAEHLAIQLAMELALEHGVRDLVILNDSQTPVNHVLGTYAVKQPHLAPIVEKTRELRERFDHFSIRWVPQGRDQASRRSVQVDRQAGGAARPPLGRLSDRPVTTAMSVAALYDIHVVETLSLPRSVAATAVAEALDAVSETDPDVV